MKIGIVCGGTGGHIFPGLATARVLRLRGHEIVLWLAGKDVESEAVNEWNGQVVTVPWQGFSSMFSYGNPLVLWRLFQAVRICRKTMKGHGHDVLLAMGSYASVCPVLAARQLGVPVVLHEANVIPGRAIRFLSRWSKAVAIGFDETRSFLHHSHIVFTGMPVNDSTHYCDSELWSALAPERFTVLVTGGSRGAHVLNQVASSAMIRLHQEGGNFQVIHLTGPEDENRIREDYEKSGVSHVVLGFLSAMDQAYKRANLAVCRSGASTCAELSAFGVPALVVPYPFAIYQHQLANARVLEKSGSVDVRLELELTTDWLKDYISMHMADQCRLKQMSAAAKNRSSGNAASALADLVLEMA